MHMVSVDNTCCCTIPFPHPEPRCVRCVAYMRTKVLFLLECVVGIFCTNIQFVQRPFM